MKPECPPKNKIGKTKSYIHHHSKKPSRMEAQGSDDCLRLPNINMGKKQNVIFVNVNMVEPQVL